MAKRLAKVSATRGGGAPVISYERRSELLGIFMMAIAFCIMLALMSYNPADNTLVQSYSFGEAFALDNNRADNALGLVGATIALFPHTQFPWPTDYYLAYTLPRLGLPFSQKSSFLVFADVLVLRHHRVFRDCLFFRVVWYSFRL